MLAASTELKQSQGALAKHRIPGPHLVITTTQPGEGSGNLEFYQVLWVILGLTQVRAVSYT